MSSNHDTSPKDRQGMGDDDLFEAEQIAADSSADSDGDITADAEDSPIKNKSNHQIGKILGLPTPIFCIVMLLIVGFIITMIVMISSNRPDREPQRAPSAQRIQQAEVQQAAEFNAIQDKVHAAITIAERATKEISALRSETDAKLASSDFKAFEKRLIDLEQGIHNIKISMNGLNRKLTNNKPLSDNMIANNSARIISIGNGVARVRDEFDEEFSLQKGDKWENSVVMSIRSDLRSVILSNGTIIK